MKDGFIIYKSFYEPIKTLTDEQMGRLFRAIFLYQLNGKADVSADISIAYHFFVNQFKIDSEKYERRCEVNRSNGGNGGRPKTHSVISQPNKTEKTHSVISQPKKPDNDNDNDKENEKDNDNEKEKKNIPITDIHNFLLSNDDWIHSLSAYHRLPEEEIVKGINLFIAEQSANGKVTFDKEDIQKHFNAWCRKKVEAVRQLPKTRAQVDSSAIIRSAELREQQYKDGKVGYQALLQSRKV